LAADFSQDAIGERRGNTPLDEPVWPEMGTVFANLDTIVD